MCPFRFVLALTALGFVCGMTVHAQEPGKAPQQGTPRGQVRLEARNGKTSFMLGDPVTLELVFSDPDFKSGDKPENPMDLMEGKGAQLSLNGTEYGDLADDVSISPATGWFRWLGRSGHDYSSVSGVTRKEERFPLLLNEGIVFREPGHYEITVTTRRLSGGERTTNAVGIDLTARPPEEEAALVRRLDSEIAGGSKGSGDAFQRLAHLPGDDAVRAKVRWMLRADDNHAYDLKDGLAASRNYDLQLQLLDAALHDPHIVPGYGLLGALAATRLYQDGEGQRGWQMVMSVDANTPVTEKAKRRAEAHRADVQVVLDSLPLRYGENRADTAYFLLEYAGADPAQLAAVHPVAVEEFAHMDPMAQGMLLQTAWAKIRDPRLVPGIIGMLDKPPAEFVGYGDALKRLIELDPERATPYVVREICNPASNVGLAYVHSLPEKSLPAADECLTRELRVIPADNGAKRVWDEKAELAVRFATAAVLPAVRLAAPDAFMSGARFAVELRFAPADAVAALRAHPERWEPLSWQVNTTYKACAAPFPAEMLTLLREQLRSPDLHAAEYAAFELEQGGEPGDRDLLLQRLVSLRDTEEGKSVRAAHQQNDRSGEGLQRLETQLMESIRQGRAWYTPNAEAARLAEGCLSDGCRNWGKPRNPDAPFQDHD